MVTTTSKSYFSCPMAHTTHGSSTEFRTTQAKESQQLALVCPLPVLDVTLPAAVLAVANCAELAVAQKVSSQQLSMCISLLATKTACIKQNPHSPIAAKQG